MSVIKELHIEKRSHHFRIYNFTRIGRQVTENFARTLVHWGFIRKGRGFQKAPLKVFAASNYNRDEYRFHINQLDDFINFLKDNHINEDRIGFNELPLKAPDNLDIPIKEGWSSRPHQIEPIEYIVKDDGPVQRMIVLYTGGGKSWIGMKSTSLLRQRFVLVARPMYIDKWLVDVRKTYDIPDEDILVIKGGPSLMALLEKCKSGNLTEKVILISNKTLQVYISNFERFGKEMMDMGYDALPDELFQLLGGGVRNIDEVHQDFHFNFKLDLYTHTSRSVSYTATFLTDDPHIQRMHEIAYPVKDRYVNDKVKPYINTVAVLFNFKRPKDIRFMGYDGKSYSHHVFEQSVIKHKDTLTNYLNMILRLVNMYFIENKERKPTDKFMVFCTSIDMCTRVTDHLNKHLNGIEVKRYVEDDPYIENLMEPIGRVSTLQSAGTNVDIPDLAFTLLATAVKSSPSNVQGFGRLRPLKDGRSPLFAYLTDVNIQKQMDYHIAKKEIISPRSLNYKEIHYGESI